MTYKIGDLVTIRPNLKANEVCGDMNVNSNMLRYGGSSARITDTPNGYYSIDVDGGYYGWTDDMFIGNKDKALERLLSLGKGLRESLAKQIVFDCAMELLYKAENTSSDVLANKLMNALQALDKED